MKKLIVALACIAALGASAIGAEALTVAGDAYLGSIEPNTPSNPANEVIYINYLITLADEQVSVTDRTYSRVGSTVVGPFPTAVTAGAVKVEPNPSPTGIDVTGFSYLLAKYSTGAHVWYVAGLNTSVDIPSDALSHYSLYNPVSVPEGGSTLMLLGMGLAGVAALRRRFGV